LTGNDIIKVAKSGVSQVRINVTYNEGLGFDADFFQFDHPDNEIINLPAGSVVEIYVGKVIVTLGKV
jgi:hypothetical protein